MAVETQGNTLVFSGYVNNIRRMVVVDKPAAFFDKKSYKLGEPLKLTLNTSNAFAKNILRVWSSSLNRFVTPVYLEGWLQFPDIPGWVNEGDKFLRTAMEWYDGYDYGDGSASSSTVTWIPTASELEKLYAKIPNQISAEAYADLRLIVEIDGTRWNFGEISAGPINISADSIICTPSFSDFRYKDINPVSKALTGNDQLLIQGISTLQVSVPQSCKPIAKYSASISKYRVYACGMGQEMSYSGSITTDSVTFNFPPSGSGKNTISIIVVDSRGYTNSVYKNISVIPYGKPTCEVVVKRKNGFESETKISIRGSYSPVVIDSIAKNTVKSLRMRYKKSSDTTWSDWQDRTVTVAEIGQFETVDLTLDFDKESQWFVEVEVADEIQTLSQIITVDSGIPILFLEENNRIGIGTNPTKSLGESEKGLLEVAGRVFSNGEQLMPSHVGQVIMSTALDTATKVAKIYGGTWQAWGAGRMPVAYSGSDTDFDTVNKTGGEKTVKLTTSQIPSHTHKSLPYANNNGDLGEQHTTGWNKASNGYNHATEATGGGQPHNNLPPYKVVYIWERIK